MKKILVPTDFSPYTSNALQFALEMSEKSNAEIHLLHAVEYPIGGTVDPVGLVAPTPYERELIDSLLETNREQMRSFVEPYKDKCSTTVELGNPFTVINEFIDNNDVDIVVMGTKGASGFKEVFIGSNAERIVRTAKCPVITINEEASFKDIKKIAFAIDINDEPSEELITRLKQFQTLLDARLCVVHINTPNIFERDHIVRKQLDEVITKFMFKNVESHIYNDFEEEQGIRAFAKYIGAELIAMSTHGRKGLAHFVAGSLAEDVVNHSKMPVWTCHNH